MPVVFEVNKVSSMKFQYLEIPGGLNFSFISTLVVHIGEKNVGYLLNYPLNAGKYT